MQYQSNVNRALFVLCLLLISPLTNAATKIGTWNKKSYQSWWSKNTTPNEWISDKKVIHQQLTDIYKRIGAKKAMNNKNFNGWTAHLLWLSIFPENYQQDDYFNTKKNQHVFRQIALDQPSQELFLLNLSPYDDQLKALKIFCKIYQAHPKEMKQYANLAVAYSIVYDQPFPEGWPHAFVEKSSLPIGDLDPLKRFEFYLKTNKAKQYLLDIKKMSPQDLKFIVDTPIKLSELTNLLKVTIKSARKLEKLFQMIRYNSPRLNTGKYIWKDGKYLVNTIAKKGGLCVDQAYFTIHTGKALGVPSIMFMGQGNSGIHAWVGAMKSYETWGFNYAKFHNQHYPVGQSYDPQTWRRLTDSECIFLDKRSDASLKKVKQYLSWAQLNKNTDNYLEILQATKKAQPLFIASWEMESAVIEKLDNTIQEKFWKKWIATFSKQNDLKFRGQKNLLAHYLKTGNTEAYEKFLSLVIKSNKSKREDLVVIVIAEKVFTLIKQKKWPKANKAFNKTMQYLRSKAGGALFYNLAQPYIRLCLDEGKKDYAKKAMKRTVKIFKAQKGSILDRDLKNLKQLIE